MKIKKLKKYKIYTPLSVDSFNTKEEQRAAYAKIASKLWNSKTEEQVLAEYEKI